MLVKVQQPNGDDRFIVGRVMLERWLRWDMARADLERNMWVLTPHFFAMCN